MVDNTIKFSKKIEDETKEGYILEFCKSFVDSMTQMLANMQKESESHFQLKEDLKVLIKSNFDNRKEIASCVVEEHKELEFAMKHVFRDEKAYNSVLKKNLLVVTKMEKNSGMEGTLTVGRKAKQQLKRVKDAFESQKTSSIAKNDYLCNLSALNTHLGLYNSHITQIFRALYVEDQQVTKKIIDYALNVKSCLESNTGILFKFEETMKNMNVDSLAKIFTSRYLSPEFKSIKFIAPETQTDLLERPDGTEAHFKELTDRWTMVYTQSKGKLDQLEMMGKKLQENPGNMLMNSSMSMLLQKAKIRKEISESVLNFIGNDVSALQNNINENQNYLEEDFCDVYATAFDANSTGDDISALNECTHKKAKVVFSYTAVGTSDMSVDTDEVVSLLGEYDENDWCYVKKTDKDVSGYVPGSYIKPMD